MEPPTGIPDTGERLEFVPWSSFDREDRTLPWRWVGLIAVTVVVVSIAAWALVDAAPQAPPPAAQTDAVPTPITLVTAATTTSVAPPLSEADLRATPTWSMAAVLAAAESFVFAYFTSDPALSTGGAAELAAALNNGERSPTYVEWVRAGESTESGLDSWEVLVRFRLITLGDQPERISQAAVSVVVELDPTGLVISAPPTLVEVEPLRVEAGPMSDYAERLVDGPGDIPVLGDVGQP